MRAALTVMVVAGVLAAGSGCAKHVTGVVRDARTGAPLGGAVVSANDGRSRVVMTNPAGQYAVKTDTDTSAMTVSAPGYERTTVSITAGSDDPVVYVDLQPQNPSVSPARAPTGAARPLVQHLDAGAPGAGSAPGSGTAGRLKELQSLYDGGLISEAEYKRMRARIVDDF